MEFEQELMAAWKSGTTTYGQSRMGTLRVLGSEHSASGLCACRLTTKSQLSVEI